MSEQRIVLQSDGWHFKIRGGNTVGPFEDHQTAELALANYCKRWRRRTDPMRTPWSNWRRSPSPIAAVGKHLDPSAPTMPSLDLSSAPTTSSQR